MTLGIGGGSRSSGVMCPPPIVNRVVQSQGPQELSEEYTC